MQPRHRALTSTPASPSGTVRMRSSCRTPGTHDAHERTTPRPALSSRRAMRCRWPSTSASPGTATWASPAATSGNRQRRNHRRRLRGARRIAGGAALCVSSWAGINAIWALTLALCPITEAPAAW